MTIVASTRLEPDEFAFLRELAAADDRTESYVLRQLVRRAAGMSAR